MSISKYVDFYLVENVSKKTNKTYYAIVMRVKDQDILLTFLTANQYNNLKNSLSN